MNTLSFPNPHEPPADGPPWLPRALTYTSIILLLTVWIGMPVCFRLFGAPDWNSGIVGSVVVCISASASGFLSGERLGYLICGL